MLYNNSTVNVSWQLETPFKDFGVSVEFFLFPAVVKLIMCSHGKYSFVEIQLKKMWEMCMYV